MSPDLTTTILFAVLGLIALWSIMNNLATGNAETRWWIVNVKENPGGFYLIIFSKAAFISFSIAVVLHAFGLIGDPFVWMRQFFPTGHWQVPPLRGGTL